MNGKHAMSRGPRVWAPASADHRSRIGSPELSTEKTGPRRRSSWAWKMAAVFVIAITQILICADAAIDFDIVVEPVLESHSAPAAAAIKESSPLSPIPGATTPLPRIRPPTADDAAPSAHFPSALTTASTHLAIAGKQKPAINVENRNVALIGLLLLGVSDPRLRFGR